MTSTKTSAQAAKELANKIMEYAQEGSSINIQVVPFGGTMAEVVFDGYERYIMSLDYKKHKILGFEDKTDYIKREQMLRHKVAMIGDGINDAPSLRKANVGIAMGSRGSDISVEAANIALINDNIEDIPHLIGIARQTIKIISVGIVFALTLNIVAMTLAILGFLSPIEGALIHNIGSVIVIIYSSNLVNYNISKKDYKRARKFGMTKNLNKSKS